MQAFRLPGLRHGPEAAAALVEQGRPARRVYRALHSFSKDDVGFQRHGSG